MKRLRFTSDELNKRVLAEMLRLQPTIDKRITKEKLSTLIYGYYNPTTDRSIRDSITELVIYEQYPFCATSDQAGYYIARSWDEAEPCLRELHSRGKVFTQKADGIRLGLQKNLVKMPNPVQGSLF